MNTIDWASNTQHDGSRPAGFLRSGKIIVCAVAMMAALVGCTTQTTLHAGGVSAPPKTAATPAEELRIAKVALQSGDLSMAQTIYERIVAKDPQSVEGITGLGDTLYGVGDYTRAGVLYDKARQLDANALPAIIGAGRVAIRQRRFDDAVTLYQALLLKQPTNGAAAAGLSTALDMKGDHAGAQAVLRQALIANPGDPYLSTNLGMSLLAGGNAAAAVPVLLDVTRFPGAPPQARENLAMAYGMMGNDKLATEALGGDMKPADVANNLRYYAYLRTHRGYQTAAPSADGPPGAAVISLPLTQMQSPLTGMGAPTGQP